MASSGIDPDLLTGKGARMTDGAPPRSEEGKPSLPPCSGERKTQMKQRFKDLPLPLRLLATLLLVFLLVVSWGNLDPLPFLDEIVLALLTYAALSSFLPQEDPLLREEAWMRKRLRESRRILKGLHRQIEAFGKGNTLEEERRRLEEIDRWAKRLERSLRRSKPHLLAACREWKELEGEIVRLSARSLRSTTKEERQAWEEALESARHRKEHLEAFLARRRKQAASVEKFYHLLSDTRTLLSSASLEDLDRGAAQLGRLLDGVHETIQEVDAQMRLLEAPDEATDRV
ncbi:MAG: hypothetical protein D6812_05755 [Deltaproteobacteria bacterium]|nr:MAG: hypothetical protein D6812_05755 [Deltaproteobacteria bacterium]